MRCKFRSFQRNVHSPRATRGRAVYAEATTPPPRTSLPVFLILARMSSYGIAVLTITSCLSSETLYEVMPAREEVSERCVSS